MGEGRRSRGEGNLCNPIEPSSTASGPNLPWLATGSPKGKAFLFVGRILQLNPAWVYYSHIAGLKNAIRPTTINIQGRNQTAPRHFPTQAFRRFTPTSALSAESATEADSALQGSTMQEWQSPQRKRIPPYEQIRMRRNKTVQDLLPPIYPRRFTPTSKPS